MDNSKPVLFGGAHFNKAIGDDEFFKKMPQFLPLKAKMAAMQDSLKHKKGCSSCQKRRIRVNIERDFAAIAASLDPEAGKTFREYFGASKMLLHAVNPTTHAAYLKEI